MSITVKAFPAKNGDCILVTYDADAKRHMLIDCGYSETFKNHLRKALTEINENGYELDNFIITHIDADHIQGAIAFLKANNAEKIVRVKSVWHNTFRHLFDRGGSPTGNDYKSKRVLERIIRRGYKESIFNGTGEISAQQGTSVGALLLLGGYSWNQEFFGGAVAIENQQKVVLDNVATIFLLSPNDAKLSDLRRLWADELTKYDVKYSNDTDEFYDDAFEMLMSWEPDSVLPNLKAISTSADTMESLLAQTTKQDTTATNGSSIAFVLFVQENSLLFLGDSHPDLIYESLCTLQKEGVIIFDLIKVSHHGSLANINTNVLSKADSRKYLISTDGGRHNHPDKSTIANIIARPTDFTREIYFNYKTTNSEFFNRDDWKANYSYSIHYLDQEPYSIIIT